MGNIFHGLTAYQQNIFSPKNERKGKAYVLFDKYPNKYNIACRVYKMSSYFRQNFNNHWIVSQSDSSDLIKERKMCSEEYYNIPRVLGHFLILSDCTTWAPCIKSMDIPPSLICSIQKLMHPIFSVHRSHLRNSWITWQRVKKSKSGSGKS